MRGHGANRSSLSLHGIGTVITFASNPNNMKPEVISVDGVNYVKQDAAKKTGSEVIVRTYSAGVHIGTVKERNGKEVTLTNARRLWSWSGAFTLSAVAMSGVDRTNSRISVAVTEILLTEAIEIIPVAEGVDLSSTEK